MKQPFYVQDCWICIAICGVEILISDMTDVMDALWQVRAVIAVTGISKRGIERI
jgi:hypothetical protein